MRKTVLAVAGVAAFAASPAFAQTSTDDMAVLLTTQDSCTVAASDLDFGTSGAVGTADVDGSATVDVTCNPGAVWAVTLDNGLSFATTRNMSGVGGTVPYDIYSDSARTSAFVSSALASFTVYGRIPSTAAAVPAGDYADTVTVTVTY